MFTQYYTEPQLTDVHKKVSDGYVRQEAYTYLPATDVSTIVKSACIVKLSMFLS